MTFIAPAATILVGILGLIGVLTTLRQRARAEATDRFWKRLMWALDAAMSDDPRTREAGERTLLALRRHPEATADDKRLIRTVPNGNRRHPLT